MLKKITQTIEQRDGSVTLSQLSRELKASPSAVAGMLELLKEKGRLVEIMNDCGICEGCVLEPECTSPARRARQYKLKKDDETSSLKSD